MFIFDIITIILGSCLLLCSAIGFGEQILKLFSIHTVPNAVYSAILGLACLNAITELLHVFFPINFIISGIILGLGNLLFFKHYGFAAARRNILKFHKSRFILRGKIIYFITLYSLPFFIIKSMGQPTIVDTGLYHLQTILWTNESAIVLGLGNLHHRLAFNHSWHTLSALMNFYPLFDRGFVSLAVAVMVLTFYVIFKLNRYEHSNLVRVALIIAIFADLRNISSPSADLGVTMVQVIVISLFFNLILEKNESLPAVRAKILVILASCSLLASLKLSSILFSICISSIVILTHQNKFSLSKFILIILTSLSLYIPHIMRGYLLSGFPLFPLKIGGLEKFFWSVPTTDIDQLNYWIHCWAKTGNLRSCPDSILDFAWLESWLYGLPFFYTIQFLCAVTVFFSVIIKIKNMLSNRTLRHLFMFSLGSWLVIVIWLIKAPDPRFLGATLTSLLLSTLLIFLNVYKPYNSRYFRMYNLINFLLPYLLIATVTISFFWGFSLNTMRDIFLKGFIPLQTAVTTPFLSVTGATINVPLKNQFCFGYQIPCSKHFRENIIFSEHNGYLYFSYD